MIFIQVEASKMKSFNKIPIFFLIYLILLQFLLVHIVPTDSIYDYRLNYDLVKDRPSNIDAVMKKIKKTIVTEDLEDYIVILGDSVAYSSPGPANTSIGYYMNILADKEGKHLKVFNLSMPSMQVGDIYTILLKMQQYSISNDKVIINVLYAGFVDRTPYPPPVFWMDYQLKTLDKETYLKSYLPHSVKQNTKFQALKEDVGNWLYSNVSILMYKDYIQEYIKNLVRDIRGGSTATEEIAPWYEKPFLKELLADAQYQQGFSSNPFNMSVNNPQVDFLNKIFELQKGKNTLYFLAAVNEALVEDFIVKDKYYENITLIDEYFEGNTQQYVNFYNRIPYDLFSDQVHLTAKGYEFLANELWREISEWKIN